LSAGLLVTLPRHPRTSTDRLPARAAIAEGVRWLRRHRLLRTLAGLLAVNTFCFQLGNVTVVLLATQTLHAADRGYGLLLAGAAVGSVLGGVAGAAIASRTGELPALLIALGANVLIFAGIGISPDPVVLGVLLGLNGFATTTWSVVTLSMRQRIVPSDLLGRVNSAYRMLGWGLMPLGSLAGGLIAAELGIRAAYPIAGALRGIALLAVLPVLIMAMRSASTERTSSPAAASPASTAPPTFPRAPVTRTVMAHPRFAALAALGGPGIPRRGWRLRRRRRGRGWW